MSGMLLLGILSSAMSSSIRPLFANGEQGLWYDPSDLSTLFQDSAGTIPVTADGDPVGLILDKSGLGNHAFQVTLASRPTYRTDGTLHWLEFDGVNDWLVTTAVLPITGTDKITILVGQRHLVNSPDGTILELSPTRVANTNSFTLFSSSGGNKYSWLLRGSGATSNWANATSSTFNAPHTGVLSCLGKISPSNATLRVNGGQVGQRTTATGTGNWGSYPLYIGRRGGASLPWKGRLYGLIVRNALTADPLLSAAEAYMATKTGVTL